MIYKIVCEFMIKYTVIYKSFIDAENTCLREILGYMVDR